jgi:hypothetical protein
VIFDGGGAADVIICERSYVTLYGGKYQWQVKGFTDHGLRMNGTKTGTIVDGLDFPNIEEGAIRVRSCTGCIVRNCRITSVKDASGTTDGIYSQENNGNIYEHNWIGIYNENPAPHCDGIQCYNDTDTTVRWNYVEQIDSKTSNAQGIYTEQMFGTTKIYGNVIYNPNGNNAIAHRSYSGIGTAQLICYNNTVTGNGNALLYVTGTSDPIIKNNIWNYGGTGASLKLTDWNGTPSNIDDNLFYSPNNSDSLYLNGSARTWSAWQALGFDAHGVNANPNLTADYELGAGSPAIDAGADLGTAYNTDFNGTTRPVGPAWDIGAFEFTSGPARTPTATAAPR